MKTRYLITNNENKMMEPINEYWYHMRISPLLGLSNLSCKYIQFTTHNQGRPKHPIINTAWINGVHGWCALLWIHWNKRKLIFRMEERENKTETMGYKYEEMEVEYKYRVQSPNTYKIDYSLPTLFRLWALGKYTKSCLIVERQKEKV